MSMYRLQYVHHNNIFADFTEWAQSSRYRCNEHVLLTQIFILYRSLE